MARKSAQFGAAKLPSAASDRQPADPIDWSYFARFTMGNTALEREVLELFAGQVPVYLDRLQAAQTAKEWRDTAHTIKGSASAIGAWRLSRIAEMVERIDVDADVARNEGARDEALRAVGEAADEVCRYIARLLAHS